MIKTRSGKVLKRIPAAWEDWHSLDDIAIRQKPFSGSWDTMRDHVYSFWPGAEYHNSAGTGYWSAAGSQHQVMVAECWPHRYHNSLWRWRIARPKTGGRRLW